MKMLADNILINPEKWPTKKHGLVIIPDVAKKVFARGIVVEVGPGIFQAGVQLPPSFKQGDHVLYYSDSAVPITMDEWEMHIVREPAILGVLEPGEFDDTETLTEGPSEAEEITDATN